MADILVPGRMGKRRVMTCVSVWEQESGAPSSTIGVRNSFYCTSSLAKLQYVSSTVRRS